MRYPPAEITRELETPLPPALPIYEVQRNPPALLCTARVLSVITAPSTLSTFSLSSSPGQPILTPVAPRQLAIQFQWSYGRDSDRALFESFVSHVWRKVLLRFGDDLWGAKLWKNSMRLSIVIRWKLNSSAVYVPHLLWDKLHDSIFIKYKLWPQVERKQYLFVSS